MVLRTGLLARGGSHGRDGLRLDGQWAAVLDESLRILRTALVEDGASYRGRFFTVSNAAVAPRPSPPLDIWLGGSSQAAYRRTKFVIRPVGGAGPDAFIERFVTELLSRQN
ncbi:LLM class flavin-dependent oxidoreductase [Mycobacterium camsae]|uniref:LLM class flavin-dependent oxidoreductase n=1 Tax=Mycobacterium gordonae TaxID=1778 RepID=UPI001F12253F|nr:LLM class flavin-dependent oxidoreductase [Mycobacterium gordonae]